MDGSVSHVAIDTRSIKTALGILALIAAPAAGAAAMVAASLFGAMTALALSAGAGFAATLELLESDRHRSGRLAGWSTLLVGWLALAAMQLDLPLLHLTGLRMLTSALLGAGAALRVARWQARRERTPPGLVAALVLALIALAVTWRGGSMPADESAATAMGIACAAELFGTGGLWLGEAFASRPSMSNASVESSASAVLQMA